MIGLDTNIVIRYLAQDDKIQSLKATKFIEHKLSDKEPGFINYIVLVEIIWVLESCYKSDKQTIVKVIYQLASTNQLVLHNVEIVLKALRVFESSNIDYADALIATININKNCNTTISFDKKAGKLSSFTFLK